jgi:flagellar biosynthesis/type III secretory pathway protein FliH
MNSNDPLEIAMARASEIIKEAEDKAVMIENEARQRGYEDGMDHARLEISEATEVIKNVANSILGSRQKLVNDIEDNIVSLAVEIAEKVIAEQIKVDPEVVLSVTRKALMVATDRENLVLRINPDDLDVVKNSKEEITSLMDGIRKIEIIPDRRIGRGGVVLETRVGNVDARIQSQLEQAEQITRGAVSHE